MKILQNFPQRKLKAYDFISDLFQTFRKERIEMFNKLFKRKKIILSTDFMRIIFIPIRGKEVGRVDNDRPIFRSVTDAKIFQ